MLIDGVQHRTIRVAVDGASVELIDQRELPFAVRFETVRAHREMATAIRDMHLRGAPLIGAAAAYGAWLACREFEALSPSRFAAALDAAFETLEAARPTAVNLRWALSRQRAALADAGDPSDAVRRALAEATAIADGDVAINAALGRHGADLVERLRAERGLDRVRVLTHCNAGWLATVDRGTVTAVLYELRERGVPLHVWVDETRPRNQGALTSWELTQNGVPNTVVCDNSGGHLMRRGEVDLVLVGTDRTARNGDVANKIGTYLKALAACDNGVPFFVALPSPSFDPALRDGDAIPIEERSPEEVLYVRGRDRSGGDASVSPYAPGARAFNPGFDVTSARLVTGYVTERGVFDADGLAAALSPDPGPGAS